jgi:hypothetical protein
MGNTLTRENVEAAFQSIFAQYGEDHTYEMEERNGDRGQGCFYTFEQKVDDKYVPACIVGQIIDRVTPESLQPIGDLEAESVNSCSALDLLLGSWIGWADEDGNAPDDAHSFTDDEDLASALDTAQSVQDNGGTWGAAYEAYRKALRRRD